MEELVMRWRLVGIDGGPGASGPGEKPLQITLSVDTTAPVIVDAIEKAAWSNGILLERIEEE